MPLFGNLVLNYSWSVSSTWNKTFFIAFFILFLSIYTYIPIYLNMIIHNLLLTYSLFIFTSQIVLCDFPISILIYFSIDPVSTLSISGKNRIFIIASYHTHDVKLVQMVMIITSSRLSSVCVSLFLCLCLLLCRCIHAYEFNTKHYISFNCYRLIC